MECGMDVVFGDIAPSLRGRTDRKARGHSQLSNMSDPDLSDEMPYAGNSCLLISNSSKLRLSLFSFSGRWPYFSLFRFFTFSLFHSFKPFTFSTRSEPKSCDFEQNQPGFAQNQ